MKKTLLITTLVAASSVSAMATAPLDMLGSGSSEHIGRLNGSSSEWTYRDVQETYYGSHYDDLGWLGQVKEDGVHNVSGQGVNLVHHRQDMSINLNSNARYEFTFEFTLNQQGGAVGDQAMAGMYLAGNSGSIFFGNAQLDRNGDRRDAVAVTYSANIANYNDNAGEDVYVPNGEFSYKLSAPYDYYSPEKVFTVVNGNTDGVFDSGSYKLGIVIETFADSSVADTLYLYAQTPDGTVAQYGPGWTMQALGFGNDVSFSSFGFVLHNDGGATATAEKMTANEYSRVVKQQVSEPDPVLPPAPDVPEPSAFGLLAGLGAIALATSRRRRK